MSDLSRRSAPHRRSVLAGLAAAVTAALAPRPLAAASPPAAYKVGGIAINIVSDGTLNVPLSFLLPETPPAEVEVLFRTQGLPETGAPAQTNVVLVRTGKDVVLIDAGSGPTFQPTAGKLQENLEAIGVTPESVTRIVFTHAHADHLWGVIDDLDDGLRFPNARYVMAAAEWDFWSDPGTPARLPDAFRGMATVTARVLKKIEDRTERLKAGDMVAAGLAYMATPGHTPGHMSVVIEDGGQRLVVGGDVLLNSAISFARPDWRIGSDFDRDRAIMTRKALLDHLAGDKIPLIGFHLAWPGLGAVERSGTAYRFVLI
jgi:glyoxylase-like metal-dependent hydrolase (beta-lactamase superfamily II)